MATSLNGIEPTGLSRRELERQRQRLLARNDWLELEKSKPLHMDFESDRVKATVAKRRKLNDQDRLRQDAARYARQRVPSIREDYMMRGALQPNNNTQDDGSMRIRIGDAALMTQTDSVSNARVPSANGRTVSSESMLFDDILDEDLPVRVVINGEELMQNNGTSLQACNGSLGHSASDLGGGSIEQSAFSSREDHDGCHHKKTNPERNTISFVGSEATLTLPNELHGGAFAGSVSSKEQMSAPTQRAVHGSASNSSLPASDGQAGSFSGGQSRHTDNTTWRKLMDGNKGTNAATTITDPTRIAFTSLKRDFRPRGNSTEKQTAGQIPVPRSIWDVPSTPARIDATLPLPHRDDLASPTVDDIATKPVDAHAQLPATKAPRKDDPDAAWKAFVFGDAEDADASSEAEAMPARVALKNKAVNPTVPPTNAATAGSSSFLTSSSGVGPPSPRKRSVEMKQGPSTTASSVPDRPSSVAGASTSATVLHSKNQHRARSRFSAPKRLVVGEGEVRGMKEIEDDE